MKNLKSLFLLVSFSIVFNCSTDSEENSIDTNQEQPQVLINPSNPDQLANVLVIPGNLTNGNPPASSSSTTAPFVGNNQTSASVTAGNTLYLPFNFQTSGSAPGYGGCYVQVDGASTFWNIPANDPTQAGQLVIPVGIPDNVLDGDFCLSYCIYDNAGQVSNIIQTCVSVEPPRTCPGFESGSDGLTIFTYDLGETAGTVTINYDTYSIPDRIDLFKNGNWFDGTGSPLGSGQFPPVMDCNGLNVDGYIGNNGSFTYDYSPGNGSTIDIYVSGCVGGGTGWDISVSCPE